MLQIDADDRLANGLSLQRLWNAISAHNSPSVLHFGCIDPEGQECADTHGTAQKLSYPRALERLLQHGLDHGQWDKALWGPLARKSAKVVFDRVVSVQEELGLRCALGETPASAFG